MCDDPAIPSTKVPRKGAHGDSDDHAKRFSEWLKRQLRLRGISANQLAKQSGIPNTSVYRYVRGDMRPDSDKAIEIARFFGADQDYVLQIAGHRAPQGRRAPDDPRLELYAKLDKVDWSPARHRLLMGIAESLQQEDLDRRVEAKRIRDQRNRRDS